MSNHTKLCVKLTVLTLQLSKLCVVCVVPSSLPAPPPSGCGNLEIGARAKRRAPGFYTHDRPSVRLDPEARGLRFLADPAAASRHGSGPVWMWRGSSCRAFASARSFHPLSPPCFLRVAHGLGLLSPSRFPFGLPWFFWWGRRLGWWCGRPPPRGSSPRGAPPPAGLRPDEWRGDSCI